MNRPKVTKIRIEYEDGTAKQASGDAAEKIMAWWENGEIMNSIHGSHFTGKCLEEVKKKKK